MAVLSSVSSCALIVRSRFSVKSFMSLLLLLLSDIRATCSDGNAHWVTASTGRRFDIEQLLQQRVSEVHPCDLNVYLCGIVLEYCRDEAHEG